MIGVNFNDIFKFGLKYRDAFIIFIFALGAPIFELFGLALFIPIFEFLKNDGDIAGLIESSEYWLYISEVGILFDIPIGLEFLLVSAFILVCCRQFFLFSKQIFTACLVQRLTHLNQIQLFDACVHSRQSYSRLLDVGSLFNLFTVETKKAVAAITVPLDIGSNLVVLFIYIVALFSMSPLMTLIALALLSVCGLIFRIYVAEGKVLGSEIVIANSNIGSLLQNKLKSLRMIKACRMEDQEVGLFVERSLDQQIRMQRAALSIATLNALVEPAVVAVSLLFLWAAFSFFGMSIELIGLYMLIMLRLVPVVKNIASKAQRYSLLTGSITVTLAARESFLDQREYDPDDGTEMGDVALLGSGDFVFDNLMLQHTEAENEIGPFNFVFKQGVLNCLYGDSGSGKTTFFDSILGFVPIVGGKIRFGNLLVEDLKVGRLREVASYCPQLITRLGETFGEHIGYGNVNFDRKQALQMAVDFELVDDDCAAADFFLKKLGVGEDEISGGQLQRLDIMRVLLCNDKQLLIFDEPTSALDPRMQEVVIRTIKTRTRERGVTSLIITHSLFVQSQCDHCVDLARCEE